MDTSKNNFDDECMSLVRSIPNIEILLSLLFHTNPFLPFFLISFLLVLPKGFNFDLHARHAPLHILYVL